MTLIHRKNHLCGWNESIEIDTGYSTHPESSHIFKWNQYSSFKISQQKKKQFLFSSQIYLEWFSLQYPYSEQENWPFKPQNHYSFSFSSKNFTHLLKLNSLNETFQWTCIWFVSTEQNKISETISNLQKISAKTHLNFVSTP